MGELVREHRLGVVARSLAPPDLAAAIREVLDRPVAEAVAERERIRVLAAERFSWSAAAATYLELVRRLRGVG
jgi:glycosyltransferase involved in cell wall biosynthesis